MEKSITTYKLSKHYDRIYAAAQALFDEYDPCKFKDGKCMFDIDWCCAGCGYLSSNGCRVKAMACKLWICREARLKADSVFMDKLQELHDKANGYGFLKYRCPKSKCIKQ